MVKTNQLLQIKEATSAKNIYPQEHEAEVHGRKKTWVQSLKQFHTCYYQLYEKSTIHAMISLQGPHSDEAFRYPNISTSMGLKLFCPWCLKLGRNTERISIYLREVHCWMVIVCNIWQVFASMTTQNILDHWEKGKLSATKSAGSVIPMKDMERLRRPPTGGLMSQKKATKKSCWVECCSMFLSHSHLVKPVSKCSFHL